MITNLPHKNTILSLKKGSKIAFDEVYRYYFKSLYGFCCGYVSQNIAEEIVQDTMLWLWENKTNLVEDIPLKTLLFTIVKNKALNNITHNKIVSKVHQKIIKKYESQFSVSDLYLEEKELFSLYKKAIENLPKEMRESFELNRVEGLTHKEIATQLGVSRQTVNYRIGQALKQLRIELKDYLPLILFLIHHSKK